MTPVSPSISKVGNFVIAGVSNKILIGLAAPPVKLGLVSLILLNVVIVGCFTLIELEIGNDGTD